MTDTDRAEFEAAMRELFQIDWDDSDFKVSITGDWPICTRTAYQGWQAARASVRGKGEPVAWWLCGTTCVEFDGQDYHTALEWEPLYTHPPAEHGGTCHE